MVSPAANRREARGRGRERRNCSHWTGMSPSPPTSNEKMRAGASAKSSRNEHEGRVEGSARSGSGGRRMAMLRLHTSAIVYYQSRRLLHRGTVGMSAV
jgi:hypothetical protein